MVNPRRKANYYVLPLRSPKFTSVDDLKEKISELVSSEVDDVGYISPGHGVKGKQNIRLKSNVYQLAGSKRDINCAVVLCSHR